MSSQYEKLNELTLAEIKKCGITHVVWLPDKGYDELYAGFKREGIASIQVCREGEAIGIAAGLYWGGKNPLVLSQNTGMLESGDSIRGIALGTNLPLLYLIGYRGYQKEGPRNDNAGVVTEPILDAYGIKHYLIETEADVWKISQAYKEAHDTEKIVAVLFAKEYGRYE